MNNISKISNCLHLRFSKERGITKYHKVSMSKYRNSNSLDSSEVRVVPALGHEDMCSVRV